jgi:hypothetical protein
MAVRDVTGSGNKTGRCVLVGDEKSGKSTILCETATELNGFIIDCDDSTGLIRNPNTKTVAIDTFGDLIEGFEMAIKAKPGIIGIDDISVPWKKWTDYWGGKYPKGIPVYKWSTIKRPWFQLIHMIKGCGIPVLISSRISYSWDTSGDEWKVNKDDWSAQSEKGFLYEMDIIIKTYKKEIDGNLHYYGLIDGARINRKNEQLSQLVGRTFENINYADHILPFFEAGNNGGVPEKIASEVQTDKEHEALEDKLMSQAEEKQKADLVAKVQRGEKKCQNLELSGWQNSDQIKSTRKITLGNDKLEKATTEDLGTYLVALKNSVNSHNQKAKGATDAATT